MPDHAPRPGTDDPLDLHGVIPPTLTVFDDDGDLDPAGTAAQAEFVVERGVHGVFALGTYGEYALLSADERAAVVEAVAGAVDDVPVIAGAGAPGTRAAVGHARRAADAGADGVVVVSPYYYAPDETGTLEHYRRVAEAVEVPVYVYTIPQLTGTQPSPATMGELASIDGIAGLKDSSDDAPWLTEVVDENPGLTVLVGSETLQFASLEVGCAGLVSGIANALPGLVVDLYAAYDAGDEDRARELGRTVRAVSAAFGRGPAFAGAKEALDLRGVDFDPGPLRSPLRRMTDGERAAFERDLRELGLLD